MILSFWERLTDFLHSENIILIFFFSFPKLSVQVLRPFPDFKKEINVMEPAMNFYQLQLIATLWSN